MSYGTDFINALNSGLNTGDTMRRRNALMGAGRMAAGGDAKGGMNALLGAGMIEEAGQFRQIGEDQRREQYRGAVTQGLQAAGNDYRKQLQALSGAAAQFGDAEQVLRSSELLQGMDDRQRQQWGEVNDAFGSLSVGLVSSKVPEAERQARALAAAPQIAQRTGMDVAQVTQMIQSTQDWSDQGLLASARNNMTAADAVQEYTRQGERQQDIQYRDSRDKVEDDQWRQSFGLQSQQLNLQREQINNPRPDNTTIRQARAAFMQLEGAEEAVANYERALEKYGTPEMLRVGANAAALEAAHQRMAVILKGDQFLQLGALVGADFGILNNVVGEPGNVVRTLRGGGIAGLRAKLNEIKGIVGTGRRATERQFSDVHDRIPNYASTNPSATTQTPPRNTELLQELPNPAQYRGQKFVDEDTGVAYVSDGTRWIPENQQQQRPSFTQDARRVNNGQPLAVR